MKRFLKFVNLNQNNLSLIVGIFLMLIVGTGLAVYASREQMPTGQISATSTDVPSERSENFSPEVKTSEYIVKVGDSLWKIAESKLSDGYLWEKLYEENKIVIGDNPGLLKPGIKLMIPDVNSTNEVIVHEIRSGDTLWDIAQSLCGDGFLYMQIATDNGIVRPNIIEPGQKLSVRCL